MPPSNETYVIVVAVDYSETGNLALERAFELALEKPAVELHVINVLPVYRSGVGEETTGAWVGGLPSPDEAAGQLESYLRERLAAFKASHGEGESKALDGVRAHQRMEVPSEEIAQLAADVGADIVVVGTHGRRGFSRLMLGSVAEATVRLAPCPVLVVRPKALPVAPPVIQPPCPLCVQARKESGGRDFWCEEHRRHHGQRHTYHQDDRTGAETNMPLVMRS